MSGPEIPSPYAEVTREGKWLYAWRIIDGIGVCSNDGCWYAYGKRRAEKRAARWLEWYIRRQRTQDVTRVNAP